MPLWLTHRWAAFDQLYY